MGSVAIVRCSVELSVRIRCVRMGDVPAEQIDDDDVVPLPSHPARMVGGPVDMHAF